MAIKIISTKNYATNGVKVMVVGPAGIGKTKLCETAPSPLIISAEAGLLSLADVDLPAIEVHSVDDVMEVYEFVTDSDEAKQYATICLDSISEIAETLLNEYKKAFKDPRAAYGELNDKMAATLRAFRDIKGKHVYFSAKETIIVDDTTNITTVKGSMPGKTMLAALPYIFDEVFAMKLGALEDGTKYRYIQTGKDFRYVDCKDRSGKLSFIEKPDLTYIFDKIAGTQSEAQMKAESEAAEEALDEENESLNKQTEAAK